MCRYAQVIYKQHYACFGCRKGFKWPQDAHRPVPPGAPSPRPQRPVTPARVVCPQCAEPMASLGRDFKPPKQTDERQWRKVELLFLHGITFHSCGCSGPGARPATLRELPAFLASCRKRSEGERLLRRTLAREAAPEHWKRERSRSDNQAQGRDHWPRRSVLQKVRAP